MSTKIVTRDIPVGDPGRGVFAARVGDRLPSELVEANKWQDYVVSEKSKTAQSAVADATGEGK